MLFSSLSSPGQCCEDVGSGKGCSENSCSNHCQCNRWGQSHLLLSGCVSHCSWLASHIPFNFLLSPFHYFLILINSLSSISFPLPPFQEDCCVEVFCKPILITMLKPSFLSPVHKQDSLEVRHNNSRSDQTNCVKMCNFQTQCTSSFYFQTSPQITFTCEL